MVSNNTARKILNKSLLDVINSLNALEPVEEVVKPVELLRVTEADFYITERGKRLNTGVASAYNLSNFKRSFYSIELQSSTNTLFDLLIEKPNHTIDLTEFNMEEPNDTQSSMR